MRRPSTSEVTGYLAAKGLRRPAQPALDLDYAGFLDALTGRRPVAFTWIEDRSLNAFADVWHGLSIVGMNTGTAEVLTDFFWAALASGRILPEIGDTDAERYFWHELEIDPAGVPGGPGPRRTPKDPARRQAAALLTELALEFTFLHEFSHIIGGHLQFRRARLGLRSPTRAIPIRPRPSKSLEVQRLLELDADAYALNMFTTNLLSRRVTATPMRLDLSDPQLFRMACLALNAYFALTSPEAFGVSWTAKTHPDASLRLVFVVDVVEPLLPAAKRPEFRDAFFTAYEDMHDLWTELDVGRPNSSRSYLSFMDKAGDLNDERLWLAAEHPKIMEVLSPYDLR